MNDIFAKRRKGLDFLEATNVKRLPARLKEHVISLCRIPRNTLNPEGMQEAVNFIENAWRQIGLGDRIVEQIFTTSGLTRGPEKSKNIVVSFGPKDAERIIIGAHYDTAAEGDPRVISNPGADDNASAIAGLLETGRCLREIEFKLKKNNIRVDIVAFANEESPYFRTENMGSYVYAKSLKEQNIKVRGMICYEMIGYFDEKISSQGYLDSAFEFHGAALPWQLKPINWLLKAVYPGTGNFLAVVGNWTSRALVKKVGKDMANYGGIEIQRVSLPSKFLPIIESSDHWAFWNNGFPAVMLTDTAYLRNPNYHKSSDKPDTLDYTKIAEVVCGVVGYVSGSCEIV